MKRETRKRLSPGWGFGILAVLLSGIALFSLLCGTGISLSDSWNALWSPEANTARIILWKIRLPRILLSIMTGAILGISGGLMQGVFQNPLADPHILGVSSGASFGAACARTLGLQVSFIGNGGVTICAFLGGFLNIVLVMLFGSRRGRTHITTQLLAGVMTGTFFSSLTTLLMRINHSKMEAIALWTMGSFSTAGCSHCMWVAPFLVLLLLGGLLLSRDMNILSQGEEAALLLGVPVNLVRNSAVLLATLATSAAVAFTGVIGGVGLMIPHALRALFGPDHRKLVPLSALGGGVFLLLMDTLARTLASPLELPVGVLTALCGGPFFLYILRRRKREDSQ